MSAQAIRRVALITAAVAVAAVFSIGFFNSQATPAADKPASSISMENGMFCWAFDDTPAEGEPQYGVPGGRTAEWYVNSGERYRLKEQPRRAPTPELLDLQHRVGYAATDAEALVQAGHFDRLWAAHRGAYCASD